MRWFVFGLFSLQDNPIETKNIGGGPHANYDPGPVLALDGPGLTVQGIMELCMNMHAELHALHALTYSVNIIRRKSLHSSCN